MLLGLMLRRVFGQRCSKTKSVSQYRVNVSKKWKEYVLKHADRDRDAKPLYEYRHGLKSTFRHVGVDSNVHNSITGHAAGGTGERYGYVWLQTAIGAIDKFPSLAGIEDIIAPPYDY